MAVRERASERDNQGAVRVSRLSTHSSEYVQEIS